MRLDAYLVRQGFFESRSRAQAAVSACAVAVNGKTVTKAAFDVTDTDAVLVSSEKGCPYVSRGGLKLEAALSAFGADPCGLVCADVGASTGGFTDCLLKHGAARVYALDSGRDQLHSLLRSDERVIVKEGVNARYLSPGDIPEPIPFLVMDVSFISQTKLLPALIPFLTDGATVITLIKPQFEVGPALVGKGGIVREEKARREAVSAVLSAAGSLGLRSEGVIASPIRGGDGNLEFLAYFRKSAHFEETGGPL